MDGLVNDVLFNSGLTRAHFHRTVAAYCYLLKRATAGDNTALYTLALTLRRRTSTLLTAALLPPAHHTQLPATPTYPPPTHALPFGLAFAIYTAMQLISDVPIPLPTCYIQVDLLWFA